MSEATTHTFQAEVRQLLDIVINSLYTDREIFLRELVSNASDAEEKLRHIQQTERDIFEADAALEISVTTDEEAKTITIVDSGIGMTREELVENLGTIAHSGTKKFLQSLEAGASAAGNVIGKFGVGFYSSFMVGDKVQVYTRSWKPEGEGLCWTSDGRGGYTIEDAPDQSRGSRIVIHLKEEHADYSKKWRAEELLKRYSNFVPFPLLLNGERVNKVEALWLKNRSEIKDDDYNEFYKFIAHAWDEPRYRLHFNADAPLAIHSLLFVPQENPEPWGMGQTDPGVALYCRRVLIDQHPKGLLPDWLRFLRGVIDSDDLPLNISRETMQDSALVQKLGDVITKRFLKFLDSEAKEDAEKYGEFYLQFSRFIKEGLITDYKHREALAKLLRFESSMTEDGKVTGLDDYVTRMKEEQKEIYYLQAPSRASIESGPYLEAFKARSLEVIYFTEPVDEYVVSSLTEFSGKKLISADSADLELPDAPDAEKKDGLTDSEAEEFCTWMKETLGDGVDKVAVSKRLVDSPVAAMLPEGARMGPQLRAMMKNMKQEAPATKVHLDINPKHPLIVKLARSRADRPESSSLIAGQLMDTALLSAGLVEDPRSVVQRLNKVLELALEK
ncbi:MAG TPA: molecular chaperone HtpG [Verrucomicrobiales bacterium]|nr:molecular chaperone HtpG [Verrucomicrobiales bacterium]